MVFSPYPATTRIPGPGARRAPPLPGPTANDHRAHQLTARAHVSERLG